MSEPHWSIEGYAIVSDDDRIADADGAMPDALRNDADWRYFQQQLDDSAAVILGRLGHEAHPNASGRLRVVVSTSSPGLEKRGDAWWWNPAETPLTAMLRTIAPQGGRIAVPGGQGVFDLFLALGYDAFHLSRAQGVRLPGGVPVFSAVSESCTAEECLARAGLEAGPLRRLDKVAGVTLSVWRRPG